MFIELVMTSSMSLTNRLLAGVGETRVCTDISQRFLSRMPREHTLLLLRGNPCTPQTDLLSSSVFTR